MNAYRAERNREGRAGFEAPWLAFIGPSLAPASVARVFSGEVHGPIKRGDLGVAIEAGYRRIAILDGVFAQSLSVSVEEIRDALSARATVVGAASMGALRAADAGVLGMIGRGWIFERYRDGRLCSEAEVALLFDPDSQRALTVPLVNVRWALELGVRRGRLNAASSAAVLEHARSMSWGATSASSIGRSASRSAGNITTLISSSLRSSGS